MFAAAEKKRKKITNKYCCLVIRRMCSSNVSVRIVWSTTIFIKKNEFFVLSCLSPSRCVRSASSRKLDRFYYYDYNSFWIRVNDNDGRSRPSRFRSGRPGIRNSPSRQEKRMRRRNGRE